MVCFGSHSSFLNTREEREGEGEGESFVHSASLTHEDGIPDSLLVFVPREQPNGPLIILKQVDTLSSDGPPEGLK